MVVHATTVHRTLPNGIILSFMPPQIDNSLNLTRFFRFSAYRYQGLVFTHPVNCGLEIF
ncbi:unnamed protein product [Moneuplotes crassus]|uniref:Uncharacterized protein n=1 Tax=Euplotes crassus TaxID=5936 RepID=A0AAD1XX89_EUPCR|nr:unnamed protein product [Moneuplotes crassus]